MKQRDLEALLADMTLKEKADQMLQVVGQMILSEDKNVITGPMQELGITEEDVRLAGSVLGSMGAADIKKIQKKYMEEQPHKIPLIFMLDVINGYRTVFPIPLGQGATFEPEVSKRCAAVAAKEAAVSGVQVTFAPMVDLVRDARWGRVMESTGEDPYLNSQFAKAMVEGFQGSDVSEKYKVGACVKHFAGYGGAVAGRDYNTVELSEHTFREFYLPAYKAGIDAGAELVMTSFNTVNGIPASGNKWLMRDILRDEMGFDGVLISDFAAIKETIAHGYSSDEADAAQKAIEAGVDIDMMTSCYSKNLVKLVEDGEVDEKLVDECVMRILKLKNKLGLFENPYKDADEEEEKKFILCKEHRALSREAAVKSFVLLKNEDQALPLKKGLKVAFIGPYTNNHNIMGSWSLIGKREETVTIEEAAREVMDPETTVFRQGCPVLGNDVRIHAFNGSEQEAEVEEADQEKMMEEALRAAGEADVVVMPIGEHFLQSGEATSRAMIDIPEVQMELFRRITAVNDNVITVLFNGRPLDLREITRKSKAVLEVWMPGTEGGHAIVDVLTGAASPCGKLPMSFPYCVGQAPVFYNEYSTGRPYTEGIEEVDRFRSRYLDVPNKPLYPFGYGLTYTDFSLSEITLDKEKMEADGVIKASAILKNTGSVRGTEVVQLYIRDLAASIVRPVKELKGYRKVTLEPGEEREVVFEITEKDLRFLLPDNTWDSEKGSFKVYIGTDSQTENGAGFELI